MIILKEFNSFYQKQVADHILDLENNEFNMNLTPEMQPDLADINTFYKNRNGNFWIALHNSNLIGTIGIYFLNATSVELRRMFVTPKFRGKEFGVGQGLLDLALNWAKANGYKLVYLETTDLLVAAGKFYIKNNFEFINKEELPDNFPALTPSGIFMKRILW